ncbi:hypothetical protein BGZ93_000988 [Podila epicladia]|nr:hypothetical protein BGZ92_003033 [Podila epicladia]KAG0098154.1 hypothetical protein BGZ93_000988 [Podila epicladia]
MTGTKKRNYRKREVTPEEEIASSPTEQSSEQDSIQSKDDEQEGLSLDELLELRKLRQRPAGVTAADLLIGDTTGKKKKKDKVAAPADPWKLSSGGGLVDLDEVRRQEEGEGSSKSTGILNSFTKQTNALDVDKHMMKYIEEEMRKRNGVSAEDEEDKAQESRGGDTDIYDELGIRRTAPKPEQEGNVQLSTTMLTAIPEVDLGMETRLRNIEETEKAKRKMFEDRKTEKAIANERFSQPAYVPSDRERISHHQQNNRRSNSNNSNSNSNNYSNDSSTGNHRFYNNSGNNQNNRGGRGGMATDDLVMERFKKRMRR